MLAGVAELGVLAGVSAGLELRLVYGVLELLIGAGALHGATIGGLITGIHATLVTIHTLYKTTYKYKLDVQLMLIVLNMANLQDVTLVMMQIHNHIV